MDADKKFLIIGNQNAITYKEIFPYLKENKMWLGYHNVKTFKQYDGSEKDFGNVCWFTNLDIKKRHDTIATGYLYGDDQCKYPTYDTYNAINCDKVNEIPDDYDGVIGVPITFLGKHCPAQFEIIGLDRYVEDNPNYGKRFTINGVETYARILIKRKPNDITYLSGVHLVTHRFKSPTEAYDIE